MRGHISKRGSRYSFVIDVGRDPITKKRKQKRVSGFRTKKEAIQAMNKMINEIQNGTYVEPSNDTFAEFIESWLEHKKTTVSDSTYDFYESYTNNHIVPALGNVKLKDIKPITIQNFYNSLVKNSGLSLHSVAHVQRITKIILNHAVRLKVIRENPASDIDIVRVPKREQKVWTKKQVDKFIEAARGHIHFIAFYLAVFTGMRQGEILGLKWDCVDFENRTIYVRRALKRSNGGELKDLKNTSSYRSIAMNDLLYEELKKHKRKQNEIKLRMGQAYNDQGFVVATKVGTFVLHSNLSRAFRLICEKIDVPKIRFHDLRHTHASLLLSLKQHPKVVQERLGHSSIEMTMDIYSHMMPNMQKEAVKELDKLFAKNTENKKDVTNS